MDRRWNAMGYRVKRGERGFRIGVVVEREVRDEEGEVQRVRRGYRGTAVFCRHQVEATGEVGDEG